MTGDEPRITLDRMLHDICDEDIVELRARFEAVATQDAERRSAAHFFADYRDME